MNQKTAKVYLELLDAAKTDPEYRKLCAECERLNGQFLELLARLPEADKELLMDYIGATGAVSLKLVEIACENTSSQDG